MKPNEPRRLWRSALMLPGAALPLLPSFTCPACLAAYAGGLSALGLGFVLDESVLAPLIAVFLLIGLYSLWRTKRSHKRALPLYLGTAGSVAIVAGRLAWDVPGLLYAGSALFVVAALHNFFLKLPRRRKAGVIGNQIQPATESSS